MADDWNANADTHHSGTTPSLTPREVECLQHVANGCKDADIATRLDISKSTVAMHVTNCRRKLGAATREQAIAFAFRRGLLK